MNREELFKLLKEAHDTGYDSGYIKGRHSGIASIAISIDPGHPNKIQSWNSFIKRLVIKNETM